MFLFLLVPNIGFIIRKLSVKPLLICYLVFEYFPQYNHHNDFFFNIPRKKNILPGWVSGSPADATPKSNVESNITTMTLENISFKLDIKALKELFTKTNIDITKSLTF